MKQIFDTVGKEVTEGNTIMLYNEKEGKWSLELVVKENDGLYACFDRLYSSTLTDLSKVPANNIMRMFDKSEKDFFYNDSLSVKELFPIDNNKIHSLMQDARCKYEGDNCWDMTREDYIEFFKPYEGKFNPDLLEDAIEEIVRKK